MMGQNLPEPYMSVIQTCKKLGILQCTLQKMMKSGKLKSERIGCRVGIRPEWIDEYINSYGYPEKSTRAGIRRY